MLHLHHCFFILERGLIVIYKGKNIALHKSSEMQLIMTWNFSNKRHIKWLRPNVAVGTDISNMHHFFEILC